MNISSSMYELFIFSQVLTKSLKKTGLIVDYYYNPILALDEFKSNFYD